MVTHNMAQALLWAAAPLMMAEGSIVLDVSGTEREGLTVNDLLERFRGGAQAMRWIMTGSCLRKGEVLICLRGLQWDGSPTGSFSRLLFLPPARVNFLPIAAKVTKERHET